MTAPTDREPVEPGWVTPAEYAARKRLSLATVRRYLAKGSIPSEQVGPGCAVRIPVSALRS